MTETDNVDEMIRLEDSFDEKPPHVRAQDTVEQMKSVCRVAGTDANEVLAELEKGNGPEEVAAALEDMDARPAKDELEINLNQLRELCDESMMIDYEMEDN